MSDQVMLFGYDAEISRAQVDVVLDFGDGRAILTTVNLVPGEPTGDGPTWHLDLDKILRAIKTGEERFG